MPRTINSGEFHKPSEVSNQDFAKTIPCNKLSVSAPFHWLSLGLNDLVPHAVY